jgi:hypothetical protein
MEVPMRRSNLPPLSARLRSSYHYYAENPEDLKTVSGRRFMEILKREYPSQYNEFIRLVGEDYANGV